MQSSRSLTRGLWNAAAASRGGPSTSTQVIASARRIPNRLSATATTSTPYFSTSSWYSQEAEQSKQTQDKKKDENVAAGEAMGATDNANGNSNDNDKGKGSDSAVEELQKTLKEKDAKIKELTDAVLYGKADMQNMQRRGQEEKAQASDYAITKFARDLTSSLDILALALRSVPESLRAKPADATETEDPRKAIAELYSGVELTSKSIVDMLKMHGVTTFDPTGEKFNPQEHEAMYQAPVPGKEPGTVLECSKAGYKIKDRILRAAQVGVVQDTA